MTLSNQDREAPVVFSGPGEIRFDDDGQLEVVLYDQEYKDELPGDFPSGPSGSWVPPSEVSFRLSPSYGLLTAHEAHEWFLEMMAENEEFEVETDRAGELPIPFCSETVRGVVVG